MDSRVRGTGAPGALRAHLSLKRSGWHVWRVLAAPISKSDDRKSAKNLASRRIHRIKKKKNP